MYLQGTSKKGIDKKTSILFYAICALYVLSIVMVLLDITGFIYGTVTNPTASLHLSFIQGAVSGCCDFIAQFILIYRCWIVWGCNIPVVILPSVLAFVFLVIWLAGNGSQIILSGQLVQPHWAQGMILAAVAVSMTVNALVTCLIVSKILKMYHEVKSALGSDDQGLGATGGSKIRTAIFIVIESGMGITPTIILVRLSMGLSFHDQESMIESSTGSLHFATNNPNSISEMETEDVGIVNRDDDIGVGQSDDIEMVAETEDVGIVDRDDVIGVQQSDDIEMVDR
ncbi:hypothetical protein BYT27DRAFT_7246945 [Phlegmacium glaucopus]|nr:hypothetical protein BYT27DRAFT_7246945 [Phlegmacium glaucopus]